MLTKTNLTEAKGIAKLNTHTDFQKKRLIKLFFRLNDYEVNLYQIPEDHPEFAKLFENVLNYFRDESEI